LILYTKGLVAMVRAHRPSVFLSFLDLACSKGKAWSNDDNAQGCDRHSQRGRNGYFLYALLLRA
jgi:hypothetical protein